MGLRPVVPRGLNAVIGGPASATASMQSGSGTAGGMTLGSGLGLERRTSSIEVGGRPIARHPRAVDQRTLGVRRLHDRVPRPGGALGLGGRHGVQNARVAGRNRRHRVGVARGEHISAGLSRADIDAPRPPKIGVPVRVRVSPSQEVPANQPFFLPVPRTSRERLRATEAREVPNEVPIVGCGACSHASRRSSSRRPQTLGVPSSPVPPERWRRALSLSRGCESAGRGATGAQLHG